MSDFGPQDAGHYRHRILGFKNSAPTDVPINTVRDGIKETGLNTTRLISSNSSCVAPWVAMVVVLVVTSWINQHLDLGALHFETDGLIPNSALAPAQENLQSVGHHLLARVAWGVPAIGYSILACALFLTCAFIVISCFRDVRGHARLQAFALIGAAAVTLLALAIFVGSDILTEPKVTSDLRFATMHRTDATHVVSIDTMFDRVGYCAFIALLVAASSTLVWSNESTPTPADLRLRLQQLQWLLYFGAAALVLRDIEMYMLYRWPGIWFDKEQAVMIDRIALSLALAHGAFFSAVLFALYFPTALVLRLRTKLMAADAIAGTRTAPEKWLDKQGLNFSPIRDFASLIAAIAPLIAGGTIAQFVGVLAV